MSYLTKCQEQTILDLCDQLHREFVKMHDTKSYNKVSRIICIILRAQRRATKEEERQRRKEEKTEQRRQRLAEITNKRPRMVAKIQNEGLFQNEL